MFVCFLQCCLFCCSLRKSLPLPLLTPPHSPGWCWYLSSSSFVTQQDEAEPKTASSSPKSFFFFNPYKQLLESRWLTVAVSKPVSHCLQKVRGSSPRRTQQQSPQCWRSIQAVLTSHRLKKNFFPLFVCNCAISMVSKKKNQLKTINKQKVVWITRNEVQVNTVVFVFKQTSRWKHDFSKATGH